MPNHLFHLARASVPLWPVLLKPEQSLIEAPDGDVSPSPEGGKLLPVPEDAVRDGAVEVNVSCALVGVRDRQKGVDGLHVSQHAVILPPRQRSYYRSTDALFRGNFELMDMGQILERITERREALGMSEQALALEAGLSKDGIRNWRRRHEAGDENAGANVSSISKVAGALNVSELWLLHGIADQESPTVAIAGQVGAGAAVPVFDAYEKGNGPQVECPPGISHHGVVAVEVVGDSMEPIYSGGDILFYSRATHEGVPNEAVGHRCVVEDEDGMGWVKQVKAGDEPGLFHLISLNPGANNMWNKRLKWAARVRLHWPAELARKT